MSLLDTIRFILFACVMFSPLILMIISEIADYKEQGKDKENSIKSDYINPIGMSPDSIASLIAFNASKGDEKMFRKCKDELNRIHDEAEFRQAESKIKELKEKKER